jgi:hypothetical protein
MQEIYYIQNRAIEFDLEDEGLFEKIIGTFLILKQKSIL